MTESVLSNKKRCFFCGSERGLHRHHVYEGCRRRISEREGCWVYLCPIHHNGSDLAVHFNRENDLFLKELCEKAWIVKNNATKEDFIRVFGKNYL